MKYFLKKNNEEIKIGQTIELSTSVDTSYGPGVATTKVKVTEPMLKKLIEDGFVVEKKEKKESNKVDDITNTIIALKPYLKKIGKKVGFDLHEVMMLLSIVSGVSKAVHLGIFIEVIAEAKNKGKTIKNKAYYLNPIYGYKPSPVIGNFNGAPVFADLEDAEEVYKLLLPLIEDALHGK